MRLNDRLIEWPTLGVLVATYFAWALATTLIWSSLPALGLVVATIAIAQFSSLQHEVLHGHPLRSQRLSEALVFPGLTLYVPFLRFKDLHLRHHFDPNLTDPYDDPESNFQDPAVWARQTSLVRVVYQANNTLAGRMLLGPAISLCALIRQDTAEILRGDRRVLRGWVLHVPGVAVVVGWLWTVGSMPLWAYALAAYLGWSLLKIRTFLEHRAHDAARARTVVVESRGPLALLFLNNNFHAVHHSQPHVAWYRLPAVYRANREHFLRRNGGYVFKDYGDIFRRFLFTAKDPVPHPVWPVRKHPAAGPDLGSDDAPELRGIGGIVEERNAGLVLPAE